MRRLTLILSDLYLPSEAAGSALPAILDLPNLEGLLRFASPATATEDWRHWLAEEMYVLHYGDVPLAACCALARDLPTAGTWLATPVHLEARLDHVRLVDRGLLRLPPDERADGCAEFARAFGPDLALHDAGERGFLLTGGPRVDARTIDPAQLLDADIADALPAGASDLRRLGAEIEMWLHGAALNARRERAGAPRISALWLWGGGSREIPAHATGSRTSESYRAFGADPFVASLAKLAPYDGFITHSSVVPAGFGALGAGPPAFVELTPMSGPPGESLAALEQSWFAPVRTALANGSLERLDLVANNREFQVLSRSAWRFWRRRRSWLEVLGREALPEQA